jgi:hypothetical protein
MHMSTDDVLLPLHLTSNTPTYSLFLIIIQYYFSMSQGSSVNVVTGYMRMTGIRFSAGAGDFPTATMLKVALGLMQTPIQ